MNTHSWFLVALVAVVAGETKNIPNHLVKGRCPRVDESTLWANQKPRHFQFGGTWYQHSLTHNDFQPIQDCVVLRYDFDGENFQTRATGSGKDGKLMKTEGKIYPSPNGEPHFMIAQEFSTPAPLVLLKTDFLNYACLYSCMNFGMSHFTDFGFIYSRTPKLHNAYVGLCQDAFKEAGMEPSRFHETPQGDTCPYEQQEAL